MAHVALGSEPLDVRTVEESVTSAAYGAICTFIGQVRRASRGRKVAYLEYNAHVPMAQKQLVRIAEEAETKWDCAVAIAHRLGKLEIGEASVIISVGSPHRAAAFEACHWCIDTLKESVPIWKREVSPDGAYWIEGDAAWRAE